MGKINSTIAKKLLRSMIYIRAVEEAIAKRYPEGKMRCPTHLSTGQEAMAAAAGLALSKGDQVFSAHRAHAHYLAKGGNLRSMIAELHGKRTGCCSGKGGSMHLVDLAAGFMGSTSIVGGSIPLGVGAALSNKILRNGKICAIFFGDAAIEEGAFHEAINFAVVKKLPALFICENNLYSVYSPLCVRQPRGRKIWKFAKAYGIQSSHGDGNDAVDAYQKIQNALKHIRKGNGPVFIEFSTYRWREHCGPNYDNDIGYRTEEEFFQWKKRDPIPRLEAKLAKMKILKPREKEHMANEIEQEIEDAFSFAIASGDPDPKETFTQLYKN